MYEPHPAFEEPDTPDAKIWRYMEFPKFISVLHSGSLHFARGDRFEDPYEGMLTDFIAKNIRASDEETFRMHHQAHLNGKLDTYINCWHVSDHESAAMWELYGRRKAGIAIQSTFNALTDAFSCVPEEIHIGLVRYGDEHLRGDSMPNGFSFWLTKRKSFEHEHELRALIWRPRNLAVGVMVRTEGKWGVVGYPPAATTDTPLGIAINVRLETLVHQIVLSPDTPDWLAQTIRGVVGKYGHTFPIHKSTLHEISYLDS